MMNKETFSVLFDNATNFLNDFRSFNEFAEDCGWQDWMQEYCSSGEGEELSEPEIAAIEKALLGVWESAKDAAEKKIYVVSEERFYKHPERITAGVEFIDETACDTKQDAIKLAHNIWDRLTDSEKSRTYISIVGYYVFSTEDADTAYQKYFDWSMESGYDFCPDFDCELDLEGMLDWYGLPY